MFSTILIANRGEIACRIIRTCRGLGIRSVAVYSDADANAPHVRLADKAVRIGPAPARDSYLRADRIIEAARTTGAQAIHPGYGFLSERLDLIAACQANGIAFIGPSTSAIEAMGDKIRSKQIAREAGVPIFARIRDGWQRTRDQLLDVTGQSRLLERNPALDASIRLRLPYIEPLNLLQIELLKRHRSGEDDPRVAEGIQLSLNAIATALRNSG